MRRQNPDRMWWIVCAALAVAVAIASVVDHVQWRDRNIDVTEATPVMGEPGLTDEGLVNVNTADMDTLMTVDGIGEKTAQKIMMYREINGPFETVEDLMQIPGLGEARFEKIRRYVAVE